MELGTEWVNWDVLGDEVRELSGVNILTHCKDFSFYSE